ncbi:chromodomain Y-like protein 2 [Diadema antillarum]|uniref:chromodomain Y-like protein 2 n=1 Tax=Diadema antillarum TaxID=105358 RepID=UPI003A83537F
MAEGNIYEVERILARRRTRKGKLEYMVRWKNFDSDEDTWEPLENLGDCMELVEEFNRKTLKEGRYERLASIESVFKKKLPNGNRKKQSEGVKDKVGNAKDTVVNGKERTAKDQAKMAGSQDASGENGRTKASVVVARNSEAAVKAQKRKRDSEVSAAKPMNGPRAVAAANSVMLEGMSPEKRMKRAHSVTGVVAQNSSSSGASNGMGSPLNRRRLNSMISSDGIHLSRKNSPILSHHSLSHSPYPKLILSPHKLRKGGQALLSKSFTSMTDASKTEDSDAQGRRTASIVARRRLSQSSPSAEENTQDNRRFSARQTESLYKYKEIVVKKCPGYTQIRLFTTTPTRNALNLKALQELTTVFEASKKDDSKVIFLSGSGSVFCSGLDLRYLQTSFVEERKRAAKNMADAVRSFVDSLINCPKVVVVAVNGPAIGLGAAILPLCDVAYASDKAYFHLPYSILGQTPEGCASHTFPQVLGLAVAGEMLYAGRKLTALEACACGLVSHTFWPTSFMQEVIPRVQRIASQSGKALMQSKLLIRGQMRAKLEYVNESECGALEDRWRSPEFYRQVKLFAENYSDM